MRKLLLLAFLFLHAITSALAQQAVKGKILDDMGAPISGASILIKGTSFGTTSDITGSFSITLPPNAKTLIISALGYGEKQIPVGKEAEFTISLNRAQKSMDEVVVVAYGTAKKESITGAVTSISAASIEKRPLTNAVAALEGSAAGIQINNTVGQPGSSPSIRIRGFSSANYSNDPLYIIDGVPFGGSVADINPADIESISVLKDAASSALYGNRASNGVIIMTTKKGLKNAPTSLNFTMNQGLYDRGINEYERLNPNQFMETMWKGYRNSLRTSAPGTYPTDSAAGARATSNLISDVLRLNIYNKPDNALFDSDGKLVSDAQILPLYAEDLDWFNPYERLGRRQDYNLSGRTGSEKNSLYFSVGYLNEKGYINYSDFKRISGRINAELNATKWLKYGFNIAGTHQISNNTPAGSGSAGSIVNPINFSRNMAPIYPVHLHTAGTGEYILDGLGNKQYDNGNASRPTGTAGRHAIWENELNKDRYYRNTVMGQAYATINFLKHFSFNFTGDINARSDDEQVYGNAVIGDGAPTGRAFRYNYRYLNYTTRQSLGWNQAFNDHNVEVLAGHENFNYEFNYLYAFKTGEVVPNGVQLVNFTTISSLTDLRDQYRTEGYFTRAKYSYKDKYFIDASFRRDASSKFLDPWGNFYSIGGSWTISKERFFDQLSNKINFLKVRASYGEVGNDGGTGSPSYYIAKALYDLNQNANLGAVYRIQFENPNLVWEKSASIGAAVEGRIYNRANFTIEYFDKKSKNLIFNYNLPLSAGPTSTSNAEAVLVQNVGSISNRGWEFTFDVDVVRTKDFTFNFGANATWLKNVVEELPEPNRERGIVSGTKKLMEGHGIYDYWLPQFVGVDQMTGNSLYKVDTVTYNASNPVPAASLVTINGANYTTNVSYAERNWSGSAIPDVFGSFSPTFRYKNITLSSLFTYALGGKIYDNSYISLMSMSGSPAALHKDILNAWDGIPKDMTATSENRIDPKGTPVVDFTRSTLNNGQSNRWLTDASYLVLKNITINYKLPVDLVSKMQLKNVTVGVSAENLFTTTKRRGMNPQQNFNGINDNIFVTPRVVSFSLNVGL
ncbi:SusC/RagA family TonB-linked outer membrane protein [Niastella caeni]|uniref:SusC/RagA family TonB-linked outer membrane protein n=1 Tax=Niastella caeni TaxID=2569763 RepID=A0A4S8HSA0_9BACT|nr:SusC/RagA family TonB-linked outer membrane protein [Niastella caeni]THU35982.1 SusC/RagA family TonB-linked outer membrane protein [Niastella caeni]